MFRNYIKGSTPQSFSDSQLPQEIEAHEYSLRMLPQAQDPLSGRRSSNSRQWPRKPQTLATTLPVCRSIASDPTRMAGNERGLLQTTLVDETIFPEHAEMRNTIKVLLDPWSLLYPHSPRKAPKLWGRQQIMGSICSPNFVHLPIEKFPRLCLCILGFQRARVTPPLMIPPLMTILTHPSQVTRVMGGKCVRHGLLGLNTKSVLVDKKYDQREN